MKKLLLMVTLCYSSIAYSDSSSIGLALPSAPSTYGQDSIRAGDLDCKNAIGGATQMEFGVTSVISDYTGPFNGSSSDTVKYVGVYARIVIPLDGPKERINCNSLYQLELRKKRIEVLKLQEELEALKRLQNSTKSGFEN